MTLKTEGHKEKYSCVFRERCGMLGSWWSKCSVRNMDSVAHSQRDGDSGSNYFSYGISFFFTQQVNFVSAQPS
jgi:hypothetical protein